MSRRQELWVFLGFLVQPLVAAIFGFVAFLLIVDDGRTVPPSGSTLSGSVSAALAFGLGTGMVGFFVTPLLALPLFVWMRRRGPITLEKTLIGGAALGNALTILVPVMALVRWPGINSPSVNFGAVVFGTAVGVFCAAVFWLIAGRRLQAH